MQNVVVCVCDGRRHRVGECWNSCCFIYKALLQRLVALK